MCVKRIISLQLCQPSSSAASRTAVVGINNRRDLQSIDADQGPLRQLSVNVIKVMRAYCFLPAIVKQPQIHVLGKFTSCNTIP